MVAEGPTRVRVLMINSICSQVKAGIYLLGQETWLDCGLCRPGLTETVSHNCRGTVHLTWPDSTVKSVASASWLVVVVTFIP